MNPSELMRLHVEALFTRDAAGRLQAVNEPGGARAPRFFLGMHAGGPSCWFRDDLAGKRIAELAAWARSAPVDASQGADPRLVAAVVERLGADAPVRKVWSGPAFAFPRSIPEVPGVVLVTPENASVLRPHFEDWIGDVAHGVPLAAALVGGVAASICCSVRVTPAAHEAGVETHPDFRRRGLGARAVSRWAGAVRDRGAVPLYSTSWDNTASLALARRLGLERFGADLHVT